MTRLLPRDVLVTYVWQANAHNLAFLNLIIFASTCGLLLLILSLHIGLISISQQERLSQSSCHVSAANMVRWHIGQHSIDVTFYASQLQKM